MDEKEYVELRGTVEQIVFSNEENGYAVLRLLSQEGAEITATGTFPGIGLGEELTMVGCWVMHPSYGEQFSAEHFERRLPTTVRGIADYLSSGLIRGIGPRLGARIAEKFGEDTFDVMLNEPERLTEIKGITSRRAKEIARQYVEQSAMRELMDFLSEHGLPIEITALLYKRFHDSAIESLKENPYLLCDPYYDVDFRLADGLAIELGLSMLSDDRTDAGIVYTLTFNLGNGHTFIPLDKLTTAVIRLLSDEDVVFDEDRILAGILRLADKGILVREEIAGRDAVYLRDMHDAEAYLAHMLSDMSERNYEYEFDVDSLLHGLFDDSEFPYSEKQKQAIAAAARNGLVILTGGPGTGKTTTVSGILRVFEALSLNTLLAAPTGRAAKRLSDLTGMEAKTIHRLLEAGFAPGGRTVYARTVTNPLECDAVILDEVSMVDIRLMQALIEALPHGARLVLVGDADQLPPVGPGNFLRDIIASQRVPTIQLTEIFRQAQKSMIVQNAHRIVEGQMPQKGGPKDDFFLIESNGLACQKLVCDLVSTRLPKAYGFDPVRDIQVLCPTKVGPTGSVELNRRLQDILNPPAKGKGQIGTAESAKILRLGDKVMQVKNDYDITFERAGAEAGVGAYNGDLGIITAVDVDARSVTVQMDDKKYTYTADQLNELEPAYAVTVHKSQGSEFPAVILPVADVPARLCYRNLLYTGVTRARKLCVLTGTARTEQTMVENVRQNMRYSGLRYLLKDAATPTEEKQELLSAT